MPIIKYPEEYIVKRGMTDTLFIRGDNKEKITKYIGIPELTVIQSHDLNYDLPYLEEVDVAAFLLEGDDIDGLIYTSLLCTKLAAFPTVSFVSSDKFKYEDKLQILVGRYPSVKYTTNLAEDLKKWFSYLPEFFEKHGKIQETEKKSAKNKTKTKNN